MPLKIKFDHFIVAVIVLMTLALIFAIIFAFSVIRDNNKSVGIQYVYGNKIVYKLNANSDKYDEIQKDCDSRGGIFEKCGSPCETNAPACIQVCAPICIFKINTVPQNI